jgi:hypothetical protein
MTAGEPSWSRSTVAYPGHAPDSLHVFLPQLVGKSFGIALILLPHDEIAELLRLACCLATERGIMVCAPIHDALLIEAGAEEIDAAVNACQMAMRAASEIVLSGFRLRTEARIVCYPKRYEDERGREMWAAVLNLLNERDNPLQ